MARCQLSNEDECYGHDCVTRVGTPCIYDLFGKAGTDDLEEVDYVDFAEDE